VRGSQFQRNADCLDHAFGIRKHFVAPESDDLIALLLEPGGPSLIVVPLNCVLAAIDLDDKATIGCEEIHHVGAERNLPAKLNAIDLAIAEPMPEPALGIG
jgi:hypothetical protein